MVTVEVPVNAPAGKVILTFSSAVIISPPDAGIALVAFVPLGVVVGVGVGTTVVGVGTVVAVGVGVAGATVGVGVGVTGVTPKPNDTADEFAGVVVASVACACT